MKRLRIFGRVQGVGFRYFIRRQAQSFGVKGWVENLPDGSVEVVAKGNALEEFLSACRTGSSSSEISKTVESEIEDIELDGFRIN